MLQQAKRSKYSNMFYIMKCTELNQYMSTGKRVSYYYTTETEDEQKKLAKQHMTMLTCKGCKQDYQSTGEHRQTQHVHQQTMPSYLTEGQLS